MRGSININDSFALLEQLDLLDKSKERVLAACLLEFEPYKKELQNQIDNLKGIREPLRGFIPWGNKVESHEVYHFVYNHVGSAILSLCRSKKILDFNVARVFVPFIVSSNISIEGQVEKSKEYTKNLLSVISKLNIAVELLQNQICNEERKENVEVFVVIRKQLKVVITDLCWLVEEIDKSMIELINPYISLKAI